MHLFAFHKSCGSEECLVIVFSSVRLGCGIESCKSTISIQQNCLFGSESVFGDVRGCLKILFVCPFQSTDKT